MRNIKMSHISLALFILLIICNVFQVFLYYVGCKKQCIIPNHNVIKSLLIINRVLSYVLFFAWIKVYYGTIFHGNVPIMALGIGLLIVGQILTIGSYAALGSNGIYYGNEYGVINPQKITTFPYNFLDHPLYIGCALTATAIILGTGFNKNMTIRMYAFYVYILVAILFGISMIIENNCVVKSR